MNLRQAAQQALEALTLLQSDIEWTSKSPTLKFVNSTVAALRQALAEPEQQPVAWMFVDDTGMKFVSVDRPHKDFQPLYTAPTPRKPQTTHWEGCEAVHPECRAKTELERKSDAIQRLWKERDELRTLNAGLVEALRRCMTFMQEEAKAYLAWHNDTNTILLAEIAALEEYLNDKG